MIHPGKIVMIDGAGKRIAELDAAQLPESVRFRPTDHGPVPVVLIVATEAGDRRTLVEYGPDDEYLHSTLLIAER